MQLHWKRCCWVYQYWFQSLLNQPKLPPLTDYGWEISNNSLRIVWDSDVNFKKVEKTVELYTKGCGCKGGCSNNKCQCRKKNSYCGPGCKCTSCRNLEHSDLDISLDSSFVDFCTCVTTLEDDSDSEQDTDVEEDLNFVDPTDNALQYWQHMNDDIFSD